MVRCRRLFDDRLLDAGLLCDTVVWLPVYLIGVGVKTLFDARLFDAGVTVFELSGLRCSLFVLRCLRFFDALNSLMQLSGLFCS